MITINSQKNPKALVVWLHGLGADENDFVPFIKNLKLNDIEFILPNAPLRPITMNQGIEMRGWFDIESLAFEHQDNQGLKKSKIYIEEIIKKRRALSSSNLKVFLLFIESLIDSLILFSKLILINVIMKICIYIWKF